MFKLIVIFILIIVTGLLAGGHFETLTNYINEGLALPISKNLLLAI